MGFWSSEKLKQMAQAGPLVQPFNPAAVKHCAYELSLGPESFLTSDDDDKKKALAEGGQLVIPPGQFGLLLSEEEVTIPNHTIGWISIKAGIKFRGLVNVSGFHVDPGFSGRLKFSVYNAGSQNIVLQRKQPIFLLWLAELDRPTEDVYKGVHAGQKEISPEDVMLIHGKIASPGQLKIDIGNVEKNLEKKLQILNHTVESLKTVYAVILTILVTLLAFALRGYIVPPAQNIIPKQPTPVQQSNNGASQPSAPPSKP